MMHNRPYDNSTPGRSFLSQKYHCNKKKKRCFSISTDENKIVYLCAWEINLPT